MVHKQTGTALISALFITTIAAIVATHLFLKQHLLIQQSQWVMQSDQMTLDLQLVSDWAIKQIHLQTTASHFIPLANVFPEKNERGVVIRGLLQDAEGKFNLNNLSHPDSYAGFAAFLHYLNSTTSINEGLLMAASIANWIQHHVQMTSAADLYHVPGLSKALIDKIKPYVTALPELVPININTASAAVLLTENPTLTATQVNEMVECRQELGGFFRLEDFIAACVSPQHYPSFGKITTQSKYYELTALARLPDQTLQISSLLVAQMNDIKNPVSIVWQENQA